MASARLRSWLSDAASASLAGLDGASGAAAGEGGAAALPLPLGDLAGELVLAIPVLGEREQCGGLD